MKKKIFAFLVFVLTGCTTRQEFPNEVINTTVSSAPVVNMSNYRIKVVVLDRCEYLMYDNKVVVHKGNCKFCEQRRKEEMQCLINKIKIK